MKKIIRLYFALANFEHKLGGRRRFFKAIPQTIEVLKHKKALNKQQKGMGDGYFNSFFPEYYCVDISAFNDYGIIIDKD